MPALSALTQSSIFIGWAKPTPVTPGLMNRPVFGKPNQTLAHTLVSLAGPASHLVIAGVTALILGTALRFADVDRAALVMALSAITFNLTLFALNILPLPGFDGSRLLHYALPPQLKRQYDALAGLPTLLLFLVLAQTGVFSALFSPVPGIARSMVLAVSGL